MSQNLYIGFTAEQFVADEYFQQWVLHPDEESEQFWSSFLNLHPSEKTTINDARKLLLDIASYNSEEHGLSLDEKASLKAAIFSHIGEGIVVEEIPVRPSRNYFFKIFAAAAAVIILIVAGYQFFQKEISKPGTLVVFKTGIGESKTIVLPDSSAVILNANSTISYHQSFLDSTNREVYLEGNAFFEVRKNNLHKQFIVHAHNLAIKVLGTQFNIDARTSAAEIALVTGKVNVVRKGNEIKEEEMLPGDKLILDTTLQVFSKTKTDIQLYKAWTEGKWNFQQTTLEDVMALVKNYYGIDAEFANTSIRQLKISAVIPVTNPDILMEIISKTLHIKATKVDGHFTIKF